MKEYQVIAEADEEKFEKLVTAELLKEWECQGGVSVVLQTPRTLPLTKTYLLSQAMVKP